jgi:hypothetical protein
MNPCPKAAMREIRPSGLMSGIWKRGSALPRQISTLQCAVKSHESPVGEIINPPGN